MLTFRKKLQIAKLYEEWRKENHLVDCPFNVISFLNSSYLIDDDKALEFLAEENKKKEETKC